MKEFFQSRETKRFRINEIGLTEDRYSQDQSAEFLVDSNP